jgi:hypothetical protein
MTTTRRLAAILAADVAGYSRLMAADEVGTLEALKAARREVVDPSIAEHNGRIVKTTGDNPLDATSRWVWCTPTLVNTHITVVTTPAYGPLPNNAGKTGPCPRGSWSSWPPRGC